MKDLDHIKMEMDEASTTEDLSTVHKNAMQAAIMELREAVKTMQRTYPYSPPCHNWQPQVEAHKEAKIALENTKGWGR